MQFPELKEYVVLKFLCPDQPRMQGEHLVLHCAVFIQVHMLILSALFLLLLVVCLTLCRFVKGELTNLEPMICFGCLVGGVRRSVRLAPFTVHNTSQPLHSWNQSSSIIFYQSDVTNELNSLRF